MNCLKQLIKPCRLVVSVQKGCNLTLLPRQLCASRVFVFNSSSFIHRNMSQKSIMSFFKSTPKKSAEDVQEKQKPLESPQEKSKKGTSDTVPVTNGKEKKQHEQERELEQSDSDGEPVSPKPVKRKSTPGSSNKKKSKRQRIESSSSEDGVPEKTEQTPAVKLEKSSPKTYSSKNQKAKVKAETPVTDKDVKSKKTPKKKDTKSRKESKKEDSKSKKKESSKADEKQKENIKMETDEQETDRKSSKRSPSPNSKKKKVKEEKPSPEPKKAAKNAMSFFIRKDVNGKAEDQKQQGKVAEAEYSPGKARYHPVEDACWAPKQPVPYIALAQTLAAIESTSARLKIIDTLANYLRSVIALTPEDLLPSVYLCLNQLAPAYHSLELGIAETYLMKAVGQCTGRSLAQVKAAVQKEGDLGSVAETARAQQRTMFAPQPLTLRKVFEALKDIAKMTGHASVSKKLSRISALYAASRGTEARFLIRSLEGKLRIGLAEQSLLAALALAVAKTPPEQERVDGLPPVLDASQGMSSEQFKTRLDQQTLILKTTYCECPNYELVVAALLQHGVMELPNHVRLTPGVPLKPMLAHPTKGITEIFNRFENEEFICEWKYDGERAQIHIPARDHVTGDAFNVKGDTEDVEMSTSQREGTKSVKTEAMENSPVKTEATENDKVETETEKSTDENGDTKSTSENGSAVKGAVKSEDTEKSSVDNDDKEKSENADTKESTNESTGADISDTKEKINESLTADSCPLADLKRARVFSRNQEDTSTRFPDILSRLPKLLKPNVASAVIDSEAVAYDPVTKQILPFQVLSTRKRKDATEGDIKVQVCVFVFDLLFLNGRPLVAEPLAERRRLLREHFREVPGEWQFAEGAECSSLEEVQTLLEESLKGSCEGLMVKALNGQRARYQVARRSRDWLKLKKDYLDGVGDTIDVVVIGAYLGRGKRAGVFGGFLLACHDADNDELQSLCKIGTGFSDEDLKSLTAALQPLKIDGPKPYYRFDPSHAPDVWLEGSAVWEVRCADLSLSPAHRAAIGLVDPDKGISLRFPRFVRVREDKAAEQATSARQVADMYLSQDQVKNHAPTTAHNDDFY